jgi:hypothetical protein
VDGLAMLKSEIKKKEALKLKLGFGKQYNQVKMCRSLSSQRKSV